MEDIAELMDYADREIKNEDLIEVLQNLEEEAEGSTEEVQKNFTVDGLAGVLELEAVDSNTECVNKVERGMI